jgi:hypothetical protein
MWYNPDMELSIRISRDVEAKLKAMADSAGLDVQSFVALTLERAATRPSLEQVLQPLREEFESSGMGDEELTQFLETAKHELRIERRGS